MCNSKFFKCHPQMSRIKYLAYYNILRELNIEALVSMCNIGRSIRSATSVQTATNSILLLAVSVFLFGKNGFSLGQCISKEDTWCKPICQRCISLLDFYALWFWEDQVQGCFSLWRLVLYTVIPPHSPRVKWICHDDNRSQLPWTVSNCA